MCGNNEASGGFNFLEGLTYNYIKKPGQNQNMNYELMRNCKFIKQKTIL